MVQWRSEARAKETTNGTTVGPTTDSNSQAPTFGNRFRKEPLFSSGPTYRHAVKEVSRFINYNWVNSLSHCHHAIFDNAAICT